MQKIPRAWPQHIVNLTSAFTAGSKHAVIYIGSEVVTLGFRTKADKTSGKPIGNLHAKKRLGSRSKTSSLTQSLTLSHIHRILAQLNSSAPITIILPDARFTRINISAPTDLAPQDIGPTLGWALEQQGFSPITDWWWDATRMVANDAHPANYDVLLIEAATVENFLERLGIAKKRLTRLIADSSIGDLEPVETYGPWLSHGQAQQVLSVLETLTTQPPGAFAKCSDNGDPATAGLNEPFNLACNLVARLHARYREAFLHSMMIASALMLAALSCWQSVDIQTPTEPGEMTQSPAPSPPVHPLFTHAHLWQQLHALTGGSVAIKRLEFRRNSWLLQIQAQNPALADAWIRQFHQRLNLPPTDVPGGPSTSAWRVLTSSSRSDNGATHLDLELHH